MERKTLKFESLYPNVFKNLTENLKLLNERPITFDIDAVTQATYVLALNTASRRLRKIIHRDELTSYWELTNIVQKNGYSKDEALKIALSAWNNDIVYLNSPKMSGISTLFKFLSEINYPYKFVSSRPKEFLNATRMYFQQNFPWIDRDNIILGRNDGEHGGDFKARILSELGTALHVEDALDEAKIIAESTCSKVLIVPQPWNESDRLDNANIKYLGHFYENNDSWPVIKFLASEEAKNFLNS